MRTPICPSTRPFALVAVAILFSVAGATIAGAQADTTKKATSQQRIPVQKESAGEVARRDSVARDSAARADSIARIEAARRDSIARVEAARRDSIARVEAARADSVAREAARRDSIARAEEERRAAEAAAAAAAAAAVPAWASRRSFYFGLAGGWSSPSGDYSDPYESGWNLTVPFGWQKAASRWGFRGDIAYDSHGGKSFTQSVVPPTLVPTPYEAEVATNFDVESGTIWSGNLDFTVDLAQWGANRLGALYLIGGGGVHFFDKPQFNVTPQSGVNAGVTASVEGDSQTKFGLNGGAGLAFGIGRAAMFLESRYFTAYTDNTNADWIPIIIGFKWH